MSEPTYPLAPHGVFRTIQGEGVLFGVPMVFVRFAGCPVNCDGCDTNYTLSERVGVEELARRVVGESLPGTRWVWVTGGEPTIHDLRPLCERLHDYNYSLALATAGINEDIPRGNAVAVGFNGFDFVSVSPHKIDGSWKLRRGDQLNIVPGLNGLKLSDLEGVDVSGFAHKFVTPFWYTPGERMERVSECRKWVDTHAGWRLGVQAHKSWGLA